MSGAAGAAYNAVADAADGVAAASAYCVIAAQSATIERQYAAIGDGAAAAAAADTTRGRRVVAALHMIAAEAAVGERKRRVAGVENASAFRHATRTGRPDHCAVDDLETGNRVAPLLK